LGIINTREEVGEEGREGGRREKERERERKEIEREGGEGEGKCINVKN
jgi:hypothetical protein